MAISQNAGIKDFKSVAIGKGNTVSAFKGNVPEGVYYDANTLTNESNPIQRLWQMTAEGKGLNVHTTA